MKKKIYQQGERDCGVACIAMILKHYKSELPIHKLRELSGTDLEGTSALGLKKTLESLSFDCLAIQADNEIWKEKELPLPLIAHVLIDNSYMHYVVVYEVKGDTLLIADPNPDKGKVKKSIDEFAKEWSGVLLLPTPKDDYVPSKEKMRMITLMKLSKGLKKDMVDRLICLVFDKTILKVVSIVFSILSATYIIMYLLILHSLPELDVFFSIFKWCLLIWLLYVINKIFTKKKR